MPRDTERSCNIKQLQQLNDVQGELQEKRAAENIIDEDEDDMDELLQVQMHVIKSKKYLNRPKQYTANGATCLRKTYWKQMTVNSHQLMLEQIFRST
jgi:beta-galactosidase GanA